MLKITFNHDSLGTEITDVAIGLNELVQNIKRDKSDGVFYSLILNLQFIQNTRSYLQLAYDNYGGIDAVVTVVIEELDPNSYKYENYFNGQVDFNLYELQEDRVGINIIEGLGFQNLVLNGMEKPVNLDTLQSENGTSLPAMLTLPNLPLHGKTIRRTSQRESTQVPSAALDSIQLGFLGSTTNRAYAMYSLSNAVIDEIKDTFDYPSQFCPNKITSGTTDPNITFQSLNRFQYRVKEAGVYTINVHASITLKSIASSYNLIWNLVIESPGAGSTYSFGATSGAGPNISASVDASPYTVTLKQGDLIYLYCSIDVTNIAIDTIELWSGPEPVSISIIADTVFPASTVKSILIYEAVKKCVQYLTGQDDCFQSTLLGRTDIGYAVDGDASLLAITNGKLIRKLTVFNTSLTRSGDLDADLKYLLDFINSVYCIGWGFETVDGVTKFVVEKRAYFYDKDNASVDLGSVGPVRAKVDPSAYFNKFIFGYSTKMEKNEINSIDEFNTLRTYVLPLLNTKNVLDVSTPMKASGYQIEQQRRLVTSSEDSRLDDELFVICVVRDSGSFKAAKNEGYDSITNVFDYATGYNYPISPARIFQNWMPFIATTLIRSINKTVKFSTGQTNFLMTSKKTTDITALAENGDFNFTFTDAIYDPMLYDLPDTALSRDLVKLIKDNPKRHIIFTDRFGATMKGYLSKKGIEQNPDKATATIELIKYI